MSEINYWVIENRLGQLIKDNVPNIGENKTPVKIFVEAPLNLITSRGPQVYIYLDSWDTPPEQEQIGGGKFFTTFLNFEIWLYIHGLDGAIASQNRDLFLQKVKEVFKDPSNRKLQNSVCITTFQGGEFDNMKDDGGFWRGVSIKLQAEVQE